MNNWFSYPTGWNGAIENKDELTSNILLVVTYAGNTINYKDAAWQINEIMKSEIAK